jgi:hypothetical protein
LSAEPFLNAAPVEETGKNQWRVRIRHRILVIDQIEKNQLINEKGQNG